MEKKSSSTILDRKPALIMNLVDFLQLFSENEMFIERILQKNKENYMIHPRGKQQRR
jgi:hypothetical protein